MKTFLIYDVYNKNMMKKTARTYVRVCCLVKLRFTRDRCLLMSMVVVICY